MPAGRHAFVRRVLIVSVAVANVAPASVVAAEGSSLRGLRSPALIEFAPAEARSTALIPGASEATMQSGLPPGLRDRPGDPAAFTRFAYSYSDTMSGVVEAGHAPRNAATATYSVSGQLMRAMGRGLDVGLGLRQQQAGNPLLAVGVRQAFAGLRGGYTLYSDRSDLLASSSHRFSLALDYGSRSSVGLSYTEGRELHNPLLPYTPGNASRDWTLSGSHSFAPQWALTYDLVNSDQASYRRPGLHLGIRHRF